MGNQLQGNSIKAFQQANNKQLLSNLVQILHGHSEKSQK